jgi:hypothetical protein
MLEARSSLVEFQILDNSVVNGERSRSDVSTFLLHFSAYLRELIAPRDMSSMLDLFGVGAEKEDFL